eukprot:m.842081 g.842081  ORF g.842081 m.842081 type:complete len:77 (+) comp59524_c0_seq36:7573-7803(+)
MGTHQINRPHAKRLSSPLQDPANLSMRATPFTRELVLSGYVIFVVQSLRAAIFFRSVLSSFDISPFGVTWACSLSL